MGPVLVNRRAPIGVGLLIRLGPRLIEPSLLTVTGATASFATCSHGQSQYSGSQPPAVSTWLPSAARQTESHQSSVMRSECRLLHDDLKLVPGGAVGLPSGARWAAAPHLQTVAGQLPTPQLDWHHLSSAVAEMLTQLEKSAFARITLPCSATASFATR